MGNAVHELRIYFVAGASACLCCRRRIRCSRCCVIYRSIPCNGSFHQGIRLADSVRNLTFDQLLSIKTFHGNLCIRRHDNAVSLLDLLICKNVFGSAGASCLHLDKTVSGLCRFFNSFCRHIGVGNSGRTGGNCQDFYLSLICASRISQSLINIFFLIVSFVNNFHKLIYRLCVSQRGGKFLIHQHNRKFTEHIQMDIIFCVWSCDQEQKSHRLVIKGFKLHSVLYYHCSKTGLLYCVTFTMWNGNSFSDSCCTFLFSCIYLFPVGFPVADFFTLYHKVYSHIKSL